MRDILADAAAWLAAGRPIAVATVVAVRGSAPRGLGASMIVTADGDIRGNVSGGCVEGAVVEACQEALVTGIPVIESYGIADDAVWSVGLMCGGSIDVLVRPVQPGSGAAADLAALAALEAAGSLSPLGAARTYRLAVRGPALGTGAVHGDASGGGDEPRLVGYDVDGCLTESDPVSQELIVPFGGSPRLIVVGAVQYGVALARLGAACGWAVTVVDPREAFAVAERFPGAEVVHDWPDRYLAQAALDERSAVCVLSHDEKIDVPAIRVALAGPAGYVGAMGSRRTHEERLDRLRARGVTPAQLARLRSPIGLDLGGRSAEETALSILAEIVAVRHGRSGAPLGETSGSLHASP